MVKIFKDVRAQRNESLLDILRVVAIAESPISICAIKKNLGVAYSGIHKNTVFLEEKGFLTSERQEKGRKKRLCDITIKGALASLFSSHIFNHSKMLERWREKEWGSGYEQPFKNINDVSELKKLVETLYLYGGSLEEVDEGLLKRGLRNPEDALNIILHARITVKKKIKEYGKYEVTAKYIPGTTVVTKIETPGLVHFMVAPDEETSKILFDLFSKDSNYENILGAYLLTALQTIARDIMDKGEGRVTSHYFPDSRSFIITGTLPDKVASSLSYPEQVLKITKKSYRDIIRPFLQSDAIAKDESRLIFRGLKYNSKRRDLSCLSKDEVTEKARKVLKQLSEG